MSVRSDLFVDNSKLKPEAANAATKAFNDTLTAITGKGPAWYEVSLGDAPLHLPVTLT